VKQKKNKRRKEEKKRKKKEKKTLDLLPSFSLPLVLLCF